MKEKFYIFLDIDGVMFDWDYIIKNNIRGGIIRSFNPESVRALNTLMEELKSVYRPELVISSTWRCNMPEVFKVFRENGVNMSRDVRISNTTMEGDPRYRGRQILEYMGGTTENKNFVIIDDESFDYAEHFDSSHIIKTDIFHNSLNTDMVSEYLESIGIPQDDIM